MDGKQRIEGMNFSVCFSAKPDYFSAVRSFAEPAVRFYNKLILTPFTFDESSEYAKAVFEREDNVQFLAPWLYEKTLGHPYFLAFICRELLVRGNNSPAKLWPEISAQLEREKFQSDLAQLSDKDVSLLRTLAAAEQDEFNPTFAKQFQHEYFGRLTDRGLLIRSGLKALPPTFPRISPTDTMNQSNCKRENVRALPFHNHRADSIPLALPPLSHSRYPLSGFHSPFPLLFSPTTQETEGNF
jgi:hypothetical protein